MSATASEGPQVPNSFANNFWGKEDAGVGPLLERMHNSKTTCEELRSFYGARAALEDEYARKLLQLARKPLGSNEAGSLRTSFDVMRGEVESIGKQHTVIAAQMKSELEEPLAAFAGGMKERRKIVQNGIEKLLKVKIQQSQVVQKTRDRYEQDCLRIKGYLAQGHMVMGQEERKNKAKLEKTQIQVATSNTDYETAIKALEETTGRWNRDWKAACDKFQDLEEERLDFTKSSLWSFANIASTVCVSDDASYEKMRVSLENCEVEKDISSFIKDRGTGQEIPDPPKYINFCRGDVNDTQSETSDDDNYSVAQFQRTINPTYRSSSPNPYAGGAQQNGGSSELASQMADDPTSAGQTVLANPAANQAQPTQAHLTKLQHQRGFKPVPHNEFPLDGMTMYCRPGPPSELSSAASPMRPASRESASEYSNPTSMSSIEPPDPQATIRKNPLNDYVPQENEQKKKSGFFQGHSPFRRKSNKDREKAREPPLQDASASGVNRKTWNAPPETQPVPYGQPSHHQHQQQLSRQYANASPEPPDDPRASYQLSVGNNVFDIANPDPRKSARSNPPPAASDAGDPIAAALAELRGVTQQTGGRVSADRYHGIATPAPGHAGRGSNPAIIDPALAAAQRGTPPPMYGNETVKRLDIPKPAFTSAEMNRTQQRYAEQMQNTFGRPSSRQALAGPPASTQQRPDGHRSRGESYTTPGNGRNGAQSAQDQHHMYRATSPRPPRSSSPLPGSQQQQHSSDPRHLAYRSTSPNPYAARQAQPPLSSSQNSSPTKRGGGYEYGTSPSKQNSPNSAVSGRPPSSYSNPRSQQAPTMGSASSRMGSRQPSANERSTSELALFHGSGSYEDLGSSGGARGRPTSYYGAGQQGAGSAGAGDARVRSKSQAPRAPLPQQERPVIHYAQAMYMYQAAIEEELSFAKGDMLAVFHLQDDGWWEAQVVRGNMPIGKSGLVPSNYLKAL